MKIQAITLFPEMFDSIIGYGVTGRAAKQRLWQFSAINPRRFADNKLGYIDDRPFGGGPGMIMMAPPLKAAIDAAQAETISGRGRVIYLSPQGSPLTHGKVSELARLDDLILLCGRYEGIDERLLQSSVDEEISIGDFVVSGGELPAMMLMDAVWCIRRYAVCRAGFFFRRPAGLSPLHQTIGISRHGCSGGVTFRKSWFDCAVAAETVVATHFGAPARFAGQAQFNPTGSPPLAGDRARATGNPIRLRK